MHLRVIREVEFVMKKIVMALCALICVMMVMPVSACGNQKTEDETFSYELNEDKDGYKITHYKKTNEEVDLVLPDKFKNLPVTEISTKAFSTSEIKSVTIPASIKTVGFYAFQYCQNLTNVVMESGVEIINAFAFIECVNLRSVEIPETVTVIQHSVFQGCTSLESIELPKSVTIIHPSLFQGCTNLKAFNISDTVTTIAARAFAYCHSIEEIIIPDSVTEIEGYAFWGCYALKKVKLPNIETISVGMFNLCGALESISIPDSVTHIEDLAFGNCYNLKKVDLGDSIESIGNNALATAVPDSVVLPKSVKVLGKYALPYHATLFYLGEPQQWAEVKQQDDHRPHFYSETENLETYGVYGQKYWYFNSENEPTFWIQD